MAIFRAFSVHNRIKRPLAQITLLNMNYPMSIFRKIVAHAFVIGALSLTAFGIPYTGTITQTVTYTDDSNYQVGQTFTGWYQYDSSSADGDFGTSWYCLDNPTALPTLYGSVFGFCDNMQDGWLSIRTGNYAHLTHLSVEGNSVNDFHKTGQMGGLDFSFSGSGFRITNMMGPSGFAYETIGTLCFSAPVAVPENVTTASLVALSLFGLVLIRRRYVP
jgi:hypothetical protein